METRLQSKNWMDQLKHVRYLRSTDHTIRKPRNDSNGIHCEGGQLGFIVDWQVDEKKPKETSVS